MLRRLLTILILSAVWTLWSWHSEPIVVGFGIFSILFTTYIVDRLGVLDSEGQPYEINIRLLRFIPWLVWEVLVANVQAAKLILSPTLKTRPHLIRVHAPQRTSLGKVIYANTITITPGTITLDIQDDVILVHALSDEMASKDSTGATSKIISWLEAKVVEDMVPHDDSKDIST
ncbi:MAG: multicomponent Na+:H+ antiporter subunit E [Polyangiales bacterium]|jgi:multicomponent Na+:H+ antiporter subunit E